MDSLLEVCAAAPLVLPLLGVVVLFALGRALPGRVPGLVAFGCAALSFLCSLVLFLAVLGRDPGERDLSFPFYSWISVGDLHVTAGVLFDPLSTTWALVVTGVGSLIFLYSVSYMEGERGYARYFAYLCLFLFSMLVLVLGDNLVLTFLGWEGVGLCSYLLIGFEYQKDTAAGAGRKAFLVNRIGDVGFLIAMFWTFERFGTLDHAGLARLLPGQTVPTLLALCFVLGAVGKSAQAPLFVWLPDAMAGPTPVSALIHAATMVTAGVYLLCRLSLLLVSAPGALPVVAAVGAATALLAGVIALRQNDLKRVLAYSTISQLGYMFLACGCGAFSAAVFHVTTHAFFKALLFLGAGAVIHALHGEQDLRRMGGLRHALPRTFASMRFGALALAGVFPFAGFFSKDEILGGVFAGSHPLLWGVGVVTAALTAFYTARMMTLCFHGEARFTPGTHPHEAPPLMAVPLSILKWLSLLGGLALGIEILHYRPLHHFLAHDLAVLGEHVLSTATMAVLLVLALAVAVGFWLLGHAWYRPGSRVPQKLEIAFPRAAKLVLQRFYVDEIYQAAVVAPLRGLARLSALFDHGIVDGVFRACGQAALVLGGLARLLQTGVVHVYALWFLVGAVLILVFTVVRG